VVGSLTHFHFVPATNSRHSFIQTHPTHGPDRHSSPFFPSRPFYPTVKRRPTFPCNQPPSHLPNRRATSWNAFSPSQRPYTVSSLCPDHRLSATLAITLAISECRSRLTWYFVWFGGIVSFVERYVCFCPPFFSCSIVAGILSAEILFYCALSSLSLVLWSFVVCRLGLVTLLVSVMSSLSESRMGR
jgi:hypothetical protein